MTFLHEADRQAGIGPVEPKDDDPGRRGSDRRGRSPRGEDRSCCENGCQDG